MYVDANYYTEDYDGVAISDAAFFVKTNKAC